MLRRPTPACEFRSTRISPQQILEAKEESSKTKKEGYSTQYWTHSRAGRKSRRHGCLMLLVGITAGLLLSALRVGLQMYSYFSDQGTYCLVFDEQFDGPLNNTRWTPEVTVGGNGNGEFQWTTDSPRNAYTEDGMLYIVPTLTADAIGEENVYNGYTLNLTADGTCTTPEKNYTRIDPKVPMQLAINSTHTECVARSNSTLGTVIPPIQSARLTTKHSAAIRYGRIEVRARMPTGDWLWPAVWMMPRDAVYGEWPRSGEIDLFENDGNQPKSRYDVHVNAMRSTLHFGYDGQHNLQRKWKGIRLLWRKYFNEDFHTFGLEWDEHGIWTWEGTRNYRVLNKKFTNYAIDRYPTERDANGNLIPPPNPWLSSPNKSAPFDEYFYLILNVAVGGTGGYFTHGPWSNSDPNAARAFIEAKDNTWGKTWPEDPKQRGMVVDYVKMYQRCG